MPYVAPDTKQAKQWDAADGKMDGKYKGKDIYVDRQHHLDHYGSGGSHRASGPYGSHGRYHYCHTQEEAHQLDLQDGFLDGHHNGKQIVVGKPYYVDRDHTPYNAPKVRKMPALYQSEFCRRYLETGIAYLPAEPDVCVNYVPRPDLATFYYQDGGRYDDLYDRYGPYDDYGPYPHDARGGYRY